MAASFRRISAHRTALREAIGARDVLVIGLCAAWCDTCGEFFETFEAVACETPDVAFLWLDIEDDADLVGDVDVENFPTLAIFERSRPIHFGVSLPQSGNLSRLVRSMSRQSETVKVDDAVEQLVPAIEGWALA